MGRASRLKRARRRAQEPQKPLPLSPQEAIKAGRPVDPPWNTRYLEYARHQGTPDPVVMLRRDENRFPGGRMAGFILWISGRWEAWRELKQLPKDTPLAQTHHAEFDAWLKTWVDDQTSLIIKPQAPTVEAPKLVRPT